MKNNTNPLFLMELNYFAPIGANTKNVPTSIDVDFVSPQPTTGNVDTKKDFKITPSQIYAGTVASGVTTKITKDLALTYKIMKKYPDPMMLKQRLSQINHPKCRILAAKLKPDTTRGEYRALIRKYICKGNLWRYFLHGVFGPVTTLWNVKNTINNSLNTADDDIGSNI